MKLCVLRPSILPNGTLQPGKKNTQRRKHTSFQFQDSFLLNKFHNFEIYPPLFIRVDFQYPTSNSKMTIFGSQLFCSKTIKKLVIWNKLSVQDFFIFSIFMIFHVSEKRYFRRHGLLKMKKIKIVLPKVFQITNILALLNKKRLKSKILSFYY